MTSRGANFVLIACLCWMLVEESRSFGIAPTTRSKHLARSYFVTTTPLRLSNRDPNRIDPRNVIIDVDFEEIEEMVEDDEWIGFTVQLSQAVREVVIEALDKMKDVMYKAEKVAEQVDARVKAEVARWRGKESYEIGDFVKAISEACQKIIEDVTGSKPMKQLGEFTTKVDTKVKKAAADFCHKDEYSPGDVTKEIAGRVKKGVLEFTGKPTYQIGDISREIRSRREQWIKEKLGPEAAKNYLSEFKEVTKKAIDESRDFGDKIASFFRGLFGKR